MQRAFVCKRVREEEGTGMPTDKTPEYSFEADEIIDFNPLEEFGFDEGVESGDVVESVLAEGPFGLPNPDAVPQFQRQLSSFSDGETAEERTKALFDQMPTLQKMLLDILVLCKEPIATQDAEDRIEEMRRNHRTIYSATTLLDLLERAGAIAKTDAQGASLSETEQEPLKIEVGGACYWHAAPAPLVHWLVTDAGLAQVESYKPLDRISECYKAEPQYAEVFDACLNACAREGGALIKQIDDIIGDEPILQKPRRYAMYFIDKLERAGAVEWGKTWEITQFGREYLASRK